MWIKILLSISIIGSGLAIFLAEKQIRPKIVELNTTLEKTESDYSKEKKEHADTTDKLEQTTNQRDSLQAEKASLQEDLQDEKNKRSQAERISQAAKAAETKAKQETARIKAMNDEYWALNKQGLTPQKIVAEHKELPLVKGELATIKDENGILISQFTKIKDEYEVLKNPLKKVLQPVGIRGRIVAVDPRWKFVILNVGSNHGVRKNGELTVSREGRFIARLKVSSVEAGHSIANVMDAYDADEDGPEEGDEVVAPNQP